MSPPDVQVIVRGRAAATCLAPGGAFPVKYADELKTQEKPDDALMRKREDAWVKAKARAALSAPVKADEPVKARTDVKWDEACVKAKAPVKPPKRKRAKRWADWHLAGRRGMRAPVGVKLSCRCSHPNLVEMLDFHMCVNERCIGGWIIYAAKQSRWSRIVLNDLLSRGIQVWQDFVQEFVGNCWERSLRGEPPALPYLMQDMRRYIRYLDNIGQLRTATANERYDYDTKTVVRGKMSIEELLHRDVSAVVNSDQPFYYTLLHEIVDMAPPAPEGPAILLCLAKQLNVQETALLLGKPIAATVARVDAVRFDLWERA